MNGHDAYWVKRHLEELKELFLSDRGAKHLGSRRVRRGCKAYAQEVDEAIEEMEYPFMGDREYHKDDRLLMKEKRDFLDAAMMRLESARECVRRSYDPRHDIDRRVMRRLDDIHVMLLRAEEGLWYQERDKRYLMKDKYTEEECMNPRVTG